MVGLLKNYPFCLPYLHKVRRLNVLPYEELGRYALLHLSLAKIDHIGVDIGRQEMEGPHGGEILFRIQAIVTAV